MTARPSATPAGPSTPRPTPLFPAFCAWYHDGGLDHPYRPVAIRNGRGKAIAIVLLSPTMAADAALMVQAPRLRAVLAIVDQALRAAAAEPGGVDWDPAILRREVTAALAAATVPPKVPT